MEKPQRIVTDSMFGLRLPDYARLSPRVATVLGHNPGPFTGPGTNTYIVGTGKSPLLLDTGAGVAKWAEILPHALKEVSGTDQFASIVATHAHADHIGGVKDARRLFGDLEVLKKPWPGQDNAAGAPVTAIDHDAVIKAEGVTLTAVFTPGHAPDHLCYYLAEERALFTGDVVLGAGTTVIPDDTGDLGQYMDSLRRLLELEAETIYPAHGPVIRNARQKIEEYIAHRELRERQVLEALADGPLEVATIVEKIYIDVPKLLHLAAARSVRSHLKKLRNEGRVVEHEDHWGSINRIGLERALKLLTAAAAALIAFGLVRTAIADPPSPGPTGASADSAGSYSASSTSSSTAPPASSSTSTGPSAPTSPSASSGPSVGGSGTVLVPDSPGASPPPGVTSASQGSMSEPPGTTEIPPAVPAGDSQDGDISYEQAQNPQVIEPQLHSLQEFIDEGDNTSPLGIEVREERRKLKSGEEAEGLLIVGVENDSPAAKAGLHAYSETARDVLQGAAVAAAMFFPPAVLAVPMLDQVHIGESYDMIIGVDGSRVSNFLDFEDKMRDVQPGETVYLSIVRDGMRKQVPVQVTSMAPDPPF